MVSPIDLFGSAIHLNEDGRVRPEEGQVNEPTDAWTVVTFHVETNKDVHSDTWAMHPAADEAMCVLAGLVRIFLRSDNEGDQAPPTAVKAGTVFVVPRGHWHRLEVYGPSDLMSITVRDGTVFEMQSDTDGSRRHP